ncbi:Rhamnose mutarotase [Macrophomina phaseolina MS6]|uniref:Rhamnose mutarotase n=1 Tax=Macrophomina phaseolina (strain MS6) TaxID=1126212 RepID=K2S2Y5_MACPH|nr:Rhamnose mutarotase [Macrophomina phaseolina MS6]
MSSAKEPRRIGQFVYLKPECLEEYKKCHAAVWPEVLEQIKDSNIVDCKSLLREKQAQRFASAKQGTRCTDGCKTPSSSPTSPARCSLRHSSGLARTGMPIWRACPPTRRCRSGGP